MSGFGFQWHISDRCNRRCAHCYQDRFDDSSAAGAASRRRMADRIFADLADEAVTINLTGGEPLLDPDLFDLLDHLAGFKGLQAVHLITNGTVFDPKLVAAIRARPIIGQLKISIESARSATDDAIRGGGHLASVSRAIEAFADSGKPLTAMLTLGRHNLADLPETIAWVAEHGFRSLIIERFVPLGRGGGMRQAVMTDRDWYRVGQILIAAVDPALQAGDLLPYRAFRVDFSSPASPVLGGAFCNLGPDSMALMPDGTVFPCRRLPIPIGKLPDEPFAAIRDRLASWSGEHVRDQLVGPRCGPCPEPDCSGCRALALAVHGDPLADDPCCARFV